MKYQSKQTIEEVAQEYALRQPFNTTSCYKSFIQGYNHAQKEIEELRRDKEELAEFLKIIYNNLNGYTEEPIFDKIEQLITKHK